MEWIGHGTAAPVVKNHPPDDPEAFGEQCFREVARLKHAGYVHGDLSEYNILNYDEQPVLIDFSHMTLLTAPNSKELLERDMQNLERYFSLPLSSRRSP